MRTRLFRLILGALASGSLYAQQAPELREILERLQRLELQNQELLTEVRSLHARLDQTQGQTRPSAEPPGVEVIGQTPAAPVAERMDVAEQRIADLDQVKITADHRLPVTLTGMLLFNAYLNGKSALGGQYPVAVAAQGRRGSGGATFRQSILGLRVDGPNLIGGGKIDGAVFMDFFGGGTGLDQTVRLRVARLDATWRKTTLGFAFDKPIVAMRDPDSLAQVGLSPLTGSGNLWLWQPQVRLEHRVDFAEQAGLRMQVGLYQTAEGGTGLSSSYSDSLALSRPGYQGRFELWAQSGNRRIEIAPGFHASSSRVVGQSVPSRIFTIDWLIRPAGRIDFTGTFFHGENTGVIGGLRQGVTVRDGRAFAVGSTGGWAQLKLRATPRVEFHLFGGQQDDRNRDLYDGGILKNQSYGANVMYRWSSNVMASFEASQVRSSYRGTGNRLNPHYDLSIAYLF